MRMREILEILRNVASNTNIKLVGTPYFPSLEVSGKGILEIHANSIWIANTLADTFLKSEILWIDFNHEFRFVEPKDRGKVCRKAFEEIAAKLEKARTQAPRNSKAEFVIVDLVVAVETTIAVAAKNILVSLDDYNNYVRETGGEACDLWDEKKHLADLLRTIKEVRLKSYPIWSSLIDLLPDGHVKQQGEDRLLKGCKTVGLDTQEIYPNWTIVGVT